MGHSLLLTGGTGFLGSHLLRLLLDNGFEVVALKRPSSDLERVAHCLDEAVFVDVGERPLREIMLAHNVSVVVHAACNHGHDGADIGAVVQTNVLFGIDLLQAATHCGVSLFINTDTLLEAGVNPYALSKKQFLQWLPYFSTQLPIANLRLGNIYGPGEASSGFLSWFIGELERGAEEIRLTPGEQLRDFIHVRDVCSVFLKVLGLTPKQGLQELDVGSGEFYSLKAFALRALSVYEEEIGAVRTRLNFGALPYRRDEVMQPNFDATALFALGWKPALSLEEGLRQTIRARRRGN